MKRIINTLIFCIAVWFCAPAQDCIGFIRYAQQTICVDEVIPLSQGMTLKALTFQKKYRDEIQIFSDYFMSQSYEAYKSLFLTADWYGLTPEEYQGWVDFRAKQTIRVESIVTYWLEGALWAGIQYFTVQNSQYVRSTFLIKKLSNQWYPASEDDEESLSGIKSLIRIIRPEFLAYAFDINTDPANRLPSGYPQMKSTLVDGNVLLGDKFFEKLKSKEATRDSEIKQIAYDLHERVDAASDFSRDRTHDPEFMTYMDSLSLNSIQQQIVLDLIKEFNYLKAAIRIAEYQGVNTNAPLHVRAIRKIYGEDRIYQSDF